MNCIVENAILIIMQSETNIEIVLTLQILVRILNQPKVKEESRHDSINYRGYGPE